MNSAAKVGEIFTKAGESFHKLADMTTMLDPVAQDLNSLNQPKTQQSVSLFFEKIKSNEKFVTVFLITNYYFQQGINVMKQSNGTTRIVMSVPHTSTSNQNQ